MSIEFSNKITVKLVGVAASDDDVVQAAQVSVNGENNPDTESPRLINALMKDRHGSPFEHNMFKFFVEAPIFVFREWHRHRISSINEMSGRYTKLIPKFYTFAEARPMMNEGTQMRPSMVKASNGVWSEISASDHYIATEAWTHYEHRMRQGVAKEVARTILPLSVYSQMYWTVNARSLMNFISLRVESDDSLVKSHPQLEIQMGAEQVEEYFALHMPLTHSAFVANGRVAP